LLQSNAYAGVVVTVDIIADKFPGFLRIAFAELVKIYVVVLRNFRRYFVKKVDDAMSLDQKFLQIIRSFDYGILLSNSKTPSRSFWFTS